MDGTLFSTNPFMAEEAVLRRQLLWRKRLATGLLVAMGALVLLSHFVGPGWWAGLLGAMATAGLVGGLADWFAVTALFRRPLGLPIPHTAIIPTQKARLAGSLGRFVAGHVFTAEEVGRTLRRIDLGGILSRFLSDPAASQPAAREFAAMLPRLLATVEDGRARRLISRLAPRLVGGPAAGRMLARALRALVAGGRHQEVLGFIMGELRQQLDAREAQLQGAISGQVREKGGRLVGWALGAQIASRVLAAVREELNKMGPDGSPVRIAFDEWIIREIDRLETDPERAKEIGAALRRLVAHETVQAWLWDVWSRLRLALEADAGKPGGHTAAFVQNALANLGGFLATDEGARERLQQAAQSVITSVLPSARTQLAGFIEGVVANWDSATIVDKLELRVGRDLQYVRLNGTGIGFLAGGLVYLAQWALFGHAQP